MAGPNDYRHGGNRKAPPSFIAPQPPAAPVERVSPVVAPVPAPPPAEPVKGDVEPQDGTLVLADAAPKRVDGPGVQGGGVDLGAVAKGMQDFARLALASPAEPSADVGSGPIPPPPPPSYVAVSCIFVGGEKGCVHPGEPFKPADDADCARLLAGGDIRLV